MHRRICSLLLILVLVSAAALPVRAHEVPDTARLGSIAISMTHQGEPVPGGSLTLYRVADVVSSDGDYLFAYTADFAECTIPVTELSSADLPRALADIAKARELEGITLELDDEGRVKFTELEQGLYLLILAVAVPVLTDVGAYCFGKAFGKHRLAPRVSPHKTWEGSLGGTACAVVLLTAAALTAGRFGLLRVRLRPLLLYLTGCSVLSQLGDLTFSALKRIAGIKDYGKLLPGHGGILDRFDSLLFAVPFTLFFDCCLCPLFGAN